MAGWATTVKKQDNGVGRYYLGQERISVEAVHIQGLDTTGVEYHPHHRTTVDGTLLWMGHQCGKGTTVEGASLWMGSHRN